MGVPASLVSEPVVLALPETTPKSERRGLSCREVVEGRPHGPLQPSFERDPAAPLAGLPE